MNGSIVAFVAAEERRANESISVGKSINFCDSLRELTTLARNRPVAAIVIDADALMRASMDPPEIVGSCAAIAPTVLRAMLSRRLLSRIHQFATVAPEVGISNKQGINSGSFEACGRRRSDTECAVDAGLSCLICGK